MTTETMPLALAADTAPAAKFAQSPVGAPRNRLGRLANWLAHPSVGVGLLGMVALALALTVYLQASFGQRAGRELILETGWFLGVQAALFAHVLATMLVRIPWTPAALGQHLAYLGAAVIVVGSLSNTLLGSDGRVRLVDSQEAALQQVGQIAHRAEVMQLPHRHRLEVFEAPENPTPSDPVLKAIAGVLDADVEVGPEAEQALAGHYLGIDLQPGTLPWRDESESPTEIPRLVHWLRAGTASVRRGTHAAGAALLTVENFQPHSEQRPFRAANDGGFAALRLRLRSSNDSAEREIWLTSRVGRPHVAAPHALTLMALDSPALLREFTHPPPRQELGRLGQLVLALGWRGDLYRIRLDEVKPDEPIELEGSGLTFRFKRSGELFDLLPDKVSEGPAPRHWPAVAFELAGSRGVGEYIACARAPQVPAFLRGAHAAPVVAAWHHVADHHFGATDRPGAVHFLRGPDQQLWARVRAPDGSLGEGKPLARGSTLAAATSAGTASDDTAMTVTAWLPNAVQRHTIVPTATPAATSPVDPAPAVRCTLRAGDQFEDLWLQLGRKAVGVKLNKRLYFARYRVATQPAGFALTLTDGPGSDDRCRVALTQRSGGVDRVSEHCLTVGQPLRMNALSIEPIRVRPLVQRQSSAALVDSRGRSAQVVEFAVRRNPGQPFVLAGVCLLALGIAGSLAAPVSRWTHVAWRPRTGGNLP